MLGAEGQNVALARDGLGAEEEGGKIIGAGGLRRVVLGLLFFDGAVVIDEDKSVLVLRVGVALCSWVSGTQVTLWNQSLREILQSMKSMSARP